MSSGSLKEIAVVAAVIEKEGKYLITRRSTHAVLPGYWEFPGGKIEGKEKPQDALQREVHERLGVTIETGTPLGENHHDYGDYEVTLTLFEAKLKAGTPEALGCADFRWVKTEELSDYEFPPADRATTSRLLGLSPAKPEPEGAPGS